MPHDTTPRFYVYILSRPDGRPFYVGKGSGRRAFDHESEARSGHRCQKCHTIRKIWKQGGQVQRTVVYTTDDEQDAYQYECELIAAYGRDNLCNQTDGGEGKSSPGESNPAAKLTRPQVAEIRRRWATETTRLVDLAAEYGVSYRTIVSVVRQEHWGGDDTPRTRSTEQRAELRRGERSAVARYTWDDIRAIRNRYATGAVSAGELAQEYQTSQGRISSILRNETWHDPEYTPPSRVAAFAHRVPRGEKHGNAKLTEADVRNIRHRFDTTQVTVQQLATEYGLYKSVIAKIVTNAAWHDPSYVPPSRRDKHRVLTAEQKAEIAARYAAGGVSYKHLANAYGCSVTAIYYAVHPDKRST